MTTKTFDTTTFYKGKIYNAGETATITETTSTSTTTATTTSSGISADLPKGYMCVPVKMTYTEYAGGLKWRPIPGKQLLSYSLLMRADVSGNHRYIPIGGNQYFPFDTNTRITDGTSNEGFSAIDIWSTPDACKNQYVIALLHLCDDDALLEIDRDVNNEIENLSN